MSTLHFFGTKVDGQQARFLKSFTDKEFENLMNDLEGVLPKGIFAWHIESEELNQRSKRVRAIGALPTIESWAGIPINPEAELQIMKIDEQLDDMKGKLIEAMHDAKELRILKAKQDQLFNKRNQLSSNKYL